MPQSRSDDKSERILGERYRRQYESNRRAHLRNSSHEIAQKKKDRARRKRCLKYFLLLILALAATGALAVLLAFWN